MPIARMTAGERPDGIWPVQPMIDVDILPDVVLVVEVGKILAGDTAENKHGGRRERDSDDSNKKSILAARLEGCCRTAGGHRAASLTQAAVQSPHWEKRHWTRTGSCR